VTWPGVATDALMARRGEIMRRALGMDYAEFELSPIAFDYEAMMAAHGYSLDDIVAIQAAAGVGSTPLLELRNLTDLVRSLLRARHGRAHLREGRGRQHGRARSRTAAPA
jgi:2-amino-4-ketopentanoate thiolase beta subunit